MRRRIDITANPEHRSLGLVRRRVSERMAWIKLRNLVEEIKVEPVTGRIQNLIKKIGDGSPDSSPAKKF